MSIGSCFVGEKLEPPTGVCKCLILLRFITVILIALFGLGWFIAGRYHRIYMQKGVLKYTMGSMIHERKYLKLLKSFPAMHQKFIFYLQNKNKKYFSRISGSVWVYGIHGDYSAHEGDANYCNDTLYLFAFILITIAWGCLGLVFLVACCACCAGCFARS